MKQKTNAIDTLKEINIELYKDILIELGMLRIKNLCTLCFKRIDIKDYYTETCRNCRMNFMYSLDSNRDESEQSGSSISKESLTSPDANSQMKHKSFKTVNQSSVKDINNKRYGK